MSEPETKRSRTVNNNNKSNKTSQRRHNHKAASGRLLSLNNTNVIGNFSKYTNISIPANINNADSEYNNIRIKTSFRSIDIFTLPYNPKQQDANACANISYSGKTITVTSILYGILHDTNACRAIHGITYINLILAISKQLVRKLPHITNITLIDAARLYKGRLAGVNLSHISQFEKGRSFYEAYGFVPQFYSLNKYNEFRQMSFDDPKYTACLHVFLQDRHTMLNTPLNALDIDKLFMHESAVFIQNRPIADDFVVFARSVSSLVGLSYEAVLYMKCSDLYMQTPDALKKEFSRCFDVIYSKINDNNRFYYPIIPMDAKHRILSEYKSNANIKDIYADYVMFLTSNTIHSSSGNSSKVRNMMNTRANIRNKNTQKRNNKNIAIAETSNRHRRVPVAPNYSPNNVGL